MSKSAAGFLAVAVLMCHLLASAPARAELLLTSNDNKVQLVDGAVKVQPHPAPDTVTILDLGHFPPQVLGELNAPGSVVGPPFSVAVSPDESLALVGSAMKIDPADPTKQIPDNTISVIDLKAKPAAVIAKLEAGKAPAGISINRQGTLALVANRNEGSVSVFSISGHTVTSVGKVAVGDEKSGPSHVAISPDGKTALVTRDGDFRISVLTIDGTKVELTKREIRAGLRPYGIDISRQGNFAVVANIGLDSGDEDTISIIDMHAKQPKVVGTYTVGQTPEGIRISPDGKWVAVVANNGSNRSPTFPFFNDFAKLVLFRVEGLHLTQVAEGHVGHWSQGAAFSKDGKTIVVCNMVEKSLSTFQWDGAALKPGPQVKVNGGCAALRTSE